MHDSRSNSCAAGPAVVRPRRAHPNGVPRTVPGLGVVALVVLAAGAGVFYFAKHSGPVTSPSEYTQLTDFTDSAVAPALSPDGRMVTFIRGGEFFYSAGQIYVKLLPNGESVRLTNDSRRQVRAVFTPDGSRIAYTAVHIVAPSDDWDTWTVPVLGGQPTRFLPNASGLTWITDHRVLFAEIMTGTLNHMGIVTATDTRAEERAIYFPPHEDAMAHYAYASPDRKSVLVVEMDQSHTFNQPCRLLPFDGSSAGRQVGPQGTCTSTAWSPDGTWMYFGARVGGSAHLWRQKFPDGRPEQITFGPIDEEGVALAPDGRSLVTSAGNRRSGIWIHDAAGERAISSEGYALAPRLSRDGTRVFYLLARDLVAWYAGWRPASAELRSVDLASGKTDSVLSGLSVTDYDVSRDGKEVACTTVESSGESQIWLASLDRRTPPRQIAHGGDTVSFGADGDLVFRSLEGAKNFLVRLKKDGTGRERVTTTPILDKFGVSPDGEWALASPAVAGENATIAVPLHGGARQENLHRLLPGRVVVGREIPVCVDQRTHARDSRAARQVAPGSSRLWSQLGRDRGLARDQSDRARRGLARTRPLDLRVRQDGSPAQSLSDPAALTGGDAKADLTARCERFRLTCAAIATEPHALAPARPSAQRSSFPSAAEASPREHTGSSALDRFCSGI